MLQITECLKLLQTESKLPIQRARMRIKVTIPSADIDKVKDKILESAETVENEETKETEWDVVCPFGIPRLFLRG